MNDVSLLTTAYTCQNFLLDLFSTDPAFEFVEALREECFRAFKESGYVWDDEAVKKLQLVDSAIRESMRLNPFGSALMPRKVRPTSILSLHSCDLRFELIMFCPGGASRRDQIEGLGNPDPPRRSNSPACGGDSSGRVHLLRSIYF